MIDIRKGTWLGQVPLVSRRSLSGAQEISDSGFSQVLAAPKAIVDFYSPGCPHCVTFKPIYEEVAAQNPDILFAAINTDTAQANAATYQISGLPTVVFFVNGKEVHRVAGGMSKPGFENEIRKAFSGGGSPGGTSLAPMQAEGSTIGKVAVWGLGLAALAGAGYWFLKK